MNRNSYNPKATSAQATCHSGSVLYQGCQKRPSRHLSNLSRHSQPEVPMTQAIHSKTGLVQIVRKIAHSTTKTNGNQGAMEVTTASTETCAFHPTSTCALTLQNFCIYFYDCYFLVPLLTLVSLWFLRLQLLCMMCRVHTVTPVLLRTTNNTRVMTVTTTGLVMP